MVAKKVVKKKAPTILIVYLSTWLPAHMSFLLTHSTRGAWLSWRAHLLQHAVGWLRDSASASGLSTLPAAVQWRGASSGT